MRILIFLYLWFFTAVLSWAQSTAQDYITAAQQAFNNGYTDLAVTYIQEYQEKFPLNPKPELNFLLGQCYFGQGKYQEAYDIFSAINPSSSAVKADSLLFWRAETSGKLGLIPESQRLYEQLHRDYPESSFHVQALYSLGWMLFEARDYRVAIEYFRQLRRSYPDSSLASDALFKQAQGYMYLMEYGLSQELFEEFFKKYPQHEYVLQAKVFMADILYGQANYPKALGLYEELWANNQLDDQLRIAVMTGLLWIYVKNQDEQKLKSWELQARKFAQDHPQAHDLRLVLGAIALEQADPQRALTWLESLLNVEQDNIKWESMLGVANAYYALRDYSKAIKHYEGLLKNSDAGYQQKALIGLGWSYVALNDQPQAIGVVERLVELAATSQDQLMAYQQMIDVLSHFNLWDQVLEWLAKKKELINQADQLEEYDYQRINIYVKSNQIQKAQLAIGDFIDDYPKSPYIEDLRYFQGVIAFKQQQYQQAADVLDQFLRELKVPSQYTPQANYLRAMALFNLNNIQEALGIFQKIIRLYPDRQDVAPYADMGIAQCYLMLNDQKEAQKRLKMMAYKYPDHEVGFDAIWRLAQSELKGGNFTESILWYKRLLAFTDHQRLDEVIYELAQVYEMIDDQQQALTMYESIKTQDNGLKLKVLMAQANLFAKINKVDDAVLRYRDIINSKTDLSLQAVVKLGQIYRERQEFEQELMLYQQALKEMIPSSKDAQAQIMFLVGDTLELMSRTEEAIDQYLNVVKRFDQDNPWMIKSYLRVAKIYEENKDWAAARVVYLRLRDWPIQEAKFAQERLDSIEELSKKPLRGKQ